MLGGKNMVSRKNAQQRRVEKRLSEKTRPTWRSGENYLRVPMVPGDAPPGHSPFYFLSFVWIASTLQKMSVEKIIQAKIVAAYRKVRKEKEDEG